MALLEATKRLNAALHLNKHPLTLTISGLGSFGDRVLFAEIIEEEHLQRVSGLIMFRKSIVEKNMLQK